MKRLLHLGNRRASTLIVAILLLPLFAWAQTEPTSEDSEPIYRFTTTMPEFPGSFNAYLAKTIQFPEDARAKGVSGTVLAEFVVEKDGRVNQVTIKVPLFPSCDEEVVRAIQGSPRWKPGTNVGQPVRCYFQVPVTFQRETEYYPQQITDAALIDSLKAILKSGAFPAEDFTRFDLENADYYRLKDYYVVRCELKGLVSGDVSNFQHYFVIDVQNRKDFYFMSLSDNMKNVYLYDDLVVNSVDYADGFSGDARYFKRKKATFKLITQRISTKDLQVKTTEKSYAKLGWKEVYGLRLY